MGARSAGNPHAASAVEGTGNVARSGVLPARQSSTLPVGAGGGRPPPATRCSQQGTRLRVRQDGGDGVPSCLIFAPCSGPSRRSLAAVEQDVRTARRPALTALARGASARAGRDEGTTARHEQRNSAK